MADYLPPVVAKLTGDDSNLTTVLTRAKEKVRRFADDVGRIKATVKVDADLTALDRKLQEARGKKVELTAQLKLEAGAQQRIAAQLRGGPVEITVKADVDTSGLDRKLQQVRAKRIDLSARLVLASGEAEKIQRQIARIKATATVGLRLDDGAQQRISEQMRRRPTDATIKPVLDQDALRLVQAELDVLTRARSVLINATADTRVAADDLALLARARSALITADADTRVAADDLALLTRSRTVTIRTRTVGGSGSTGGGAVGAAAGTADVMGALISLAPALVPVAAGAAAVAASVAAATVAVGAFGATVKPQIKAISDASTAQAAYTKAVAKYGPTSQQAAQAQTAFADALSAMPPATRQAAGAVMVLKDNFKKWSDGLAQFTMVPVTRSLAVVQAILPKLTPMVQGASLQFARLVAVAGGAVSSPGFDALSKRFSDFANKTLASATDAIIHFSRELAGGSANGPINQFMDYVRTNGPLVKETLANLSQAVLALLQGAAQAGPGMLSLVNAVSKLVASLPTSFIATALSAYSAFKLFSLARPGISGVQTAIANLSTRTTALRTAAVGAGGGVRGLSAAFGTLSTGAKLGVAVVAIAGLVIALKAMSDIGKKAPPDVEALTTSIGNFGRTGQVSGEALRVYGSNLNQLSSAFSTISKSAANNGIVKALDKISSGFGLFGDGTIQAAQKQVDGFDNSLASLVKSGHADIAASALSRMEAEYAKSGKPVSDLTNHIDNYKSALADQAFEQQLAADSMGLFGTQAQAVQKKLAAQKQTADGLRQSIQALNDVNRQAAGGQIAMEAAIDAANKAAKDNGKTLSFNTEKGRANRTALLDLASSTDDYTAKLLDQNASWDVVNAAAQRGRDNLIASAMRMGANATEAKKLADQYLKIPSQVKTIAAFVKASAESALATMKKKLASFPKNAKTKASFDYKQAAANVSYMQQLVDRMHGKTVTVQINGVATGVNAAQYYSQGPHAYGGVIRKFAGGGTVPGYAPLRDRVHAILSPGEGVLIPEATRAMGGEAGINNINRQARGSGAGVAALGGQAMAGLRQGASGAPAVGRWVGQGLAQGITGGVSDVAAASVGMGKAAVTAFSTELGIKSPSTKFKALGTYVNSGLVQGLTGSTSAVKTATKKISSLISGVVGSSHKGLRKWVAEENADLNQLAKNRDTVASKLKSAQTKLADLQKAWTDEKNSISSGIMSGSSVVTAAPQAGFALTGQDVLNSMRDQMAKTQQFAANLAALKKKGLRSDLLEQLAAAGVDQGSETATALVGSSKGTIAAINATQKSTKSAADATGKTVADAMYSAGIKSAQGLVKGLQSQEKAIENQMLKIAKSMQKAIKKALGIKSPSAVMAELGDYTAKGMAVGINRSAKHAIIAAQGLAMSVRQGATITGSPLSVGGASAGGGDVHNHFEFHIEGSVATVDTLARDVEAAFLRRGMRNPVTYQAYKR